MNYLSIASLCPCMMSPRWTQLRLLLWKCYVTVVRRHLLVFVLELLLPCGLTLTMVYTRQMVSFTSVTNSTIFGPFSLNRLPSRFRLSPPSSDHWNLLFAPDKGPARAVVERVASAAVPPLQVQGFRTEAAMVQHYVDAVNKRDSILGGVVFTLMDANDSITDFDKYIEFKVRLRAAPKMKLSVSEPLQSWSTESNFPLQFVFSPRHPETKYDGSPGYVSEGFLFLQHAIFTEIIQHVTWKLNITPPVPTQLQLCRFPLPPYVSDSFLFILQNFFPIIVLLSFLYPSLNAVRHVTAEKESGMKGYLVTMGIRPLLNYVAWYITMLVVMIITSVLLVIIATTSFTNKGSVLRQSDPVLVFLLLFTFSMSTLSFAFFISSLFNKANSAASGHGIAYILTFAPFLFVFSQNQDYSYGFAIAVCFMCNTALPLGITIIALLEAQGEGAHWYNISRQSPSFGLSLLNILGMLIVDCFVYAALFCFVERWTARTWTLKGMWTHLIAREDTPGKSRETEPPEAKQKDKNVYFEQYYPKIFAGIVLKNLTKVFGSKKVVNKVSFKAYRGQITALLGHNGAGKTTTIRMITGQLKPTGGNVLIDGHDVAKDSKAAHQHLGICAQQDIHFDNMTVLEHLLFFCKLKQMSASDTEEQARKMMSALNLHRKADVVSKHLSGGMKRKLSIGVALIGMSKVVLLDEPTAGMDPAARRQMWDLLLFEKTHRTILLTTHSMEEADALGDRIAIMANGTIQCCGTSFFLKKNLGAGYHMTIVKTPECNVRTILEVVVAFVPSAEIQSNVGAELAFRLSRYDQPYFRHMFGYLEENKGKLGISSFGVSVTTLEEVFLRVGDYAANAMKKLRRTGESEQLDENTTNQLISVLGSFKSPVDENQSAQLFGYRLFVQQTWAILTLNALNTTRNKGLTLSQLLVPMCVLLFTLTWIAALPKLHIPGPRLLDINAIYTTTVPFSFRGPSSAALAAAFVKVIRPQAEPLLLQKDVVTYLQGHFSSARDAFVLDEVVAADLTDSDNSTSESSRKALMYFNNQMFHTPAIALATFQKALLIETTNDEKSELRIINHPFPRVVEEKANKLITMHRESFQIGQQTILATSLLVATFTAFLVQDHVSNSRHLQRTCGLKMTSYWVANLTWNLWIYLVSCLLVMLSYLVFGTQGFSGYKEQAILFLLYFYYGCSALTAVASASYFFFDYSSAYVRFGIITFIAGISGLVLVAIFEWPGLSDLRDVASGIDGVYTFIVPIYALGRAFSNLYRTAHYNQVCNDASTQAFLCEVMPDRARYCCKDYCKEKDCIDWQPDLLAWGTPGIIKAFLCFSLHTVLGLTALLICERNALYFVERVTVGPAPTQPLDANTGEDKDSPCATGKIAEDADVLEEKLRVTSKDVSELAKNDIVLLKEMSRTYGSITAVNGLSLGIKRGECFGLLGINGAGKTTTFKMLTGTITMSSGDAFVDGYSVTKDTLQVRQRIGYCPQQDALPDFLTAREVLTLYASIRGIPRHLMTPLSSVLSRLFYFSMHLDTKIKDLSGGNKRKVSTAVAFMGSPLLVILDEPSTGMDPVAKRCLWHSLQQLMLHGRSIILTSHSMEECEAMCSRLVIMVNGQFCCLGSPQHLKNKFGSGYSIMVKVARQRSSLTSVTSWTSLSIEESVSSEIVAIKKYMSVRFPSIELIGLHNGLLEYHLPSSQLSWAQVFDVMDQVKTAFNVVDYSVAQLTLEQVFLHFAMLQREERK
ncbi:phospholipid-transporting ATPase ABCA3-like isoform X2 [Ornithodoros turicata]|uniref:phospholipid-transporting ATPase ABCA3-like isoform X2 n=1 Tax=Ornithodoros turicata TaxID=34597 RepID=UPI003138DF5E